jgi:Protein of unknown function (DUF2934)
LTDETMPSQTTAACWEAREITCVKASEKLARDLREDEKHLVKRGVRLMARLVEENRGYWIVSDGTIEGNSIPSNLRFLYKPHWTIVPAIPVRSESDLGMPDMTSSQLLKDRIRIRSYELWEQDGRPDDRADYYWYLAQAEVETEDGTIESQ